jgi:hypothetical protein
VDNTGRTEPQETNERTEERTEPKKEPKNEPNRRTELNKEPNEPNRTEKRTNEMSGKKGEKEVLAKHSLLVAREVAAQVAAFTEGQDIEEHLRRLDDVAELMMVDDVTKYQAMLLSMDETTRTEFNAWLKTENLRDEVRGNFEALKKRLLEKFRVRRSILERVAFVTQPRRKEKRIIVDVLERKRVYEEVIAEIVKNKELLLVETTLQLLQPEDRADYCNLRPDETKREMNYLLEFIRRKEEERLREGTQRQIHQKVKPNEESKNEKKEDRMKETKKLFREEGRKNRDEPNGRDEERARLMAEGRCFTCNDVGHIAAHCPLKKSNKMKKGSTSDVVATVDFSPTKRTERKGASAKTTKGVWPTSYYDPDEDSSGEEDSD